MGEIADMMLDGTLDEQTGEYIGRGPGYPRTRVKGHYNTIGAETSPIDVNRLKIRAVRKELAILVKENERNNVHRPLDMARQAMNKKYGSGWRNRGMIVNDSNQWTDENKPDWWNEKLQRVMQPGIDLGGGHLIGRLADAHINGDVYHDFTIIDYSGKRGKKRYTIRNGKKTLKVKFNQLSNFRK